MQVAQNQPECELASEASSSGKVPSVDEYVGELLARIQPAQASEERRRSVAQYVQDVIARAFLPAHEVKAFTYGSVPLKTYLPDGDIDLAIFQNSKGAPQHLRDSWFLQLSSYLQREEHNLGAPCRIKDVQVIHAEVKLVKCLVDNIVVDISFQSLGGLCTVNFLESIDRRIDDHHLFKRSIILVKAWCYYESRLLGAHHGLISTYALETMVLYIFMVYHKTVTTPLKVLHKFLTVFSSFDWDKLCLSLQGPIPLSTFPDPKPLPFPDADGPPLLKEDFLADMRHMYSPPGLSPDGAAPSTTPRNFQLKFLNIMDPLLPTNNLGRSVNRSSFARIRRALEYGAKRLTAILEMDPMEGVDAARAFFRNTWNAQRSQVSSAGLRLPQAGKAGAAAEAPRPLSAAQRAAQSAPGTPKMHMPAAHHSGWPATQLPQMLAGTTAPLLVQQQQLQQLMIQIGQQHMQQGQAAFTSMMQGGQCPTAGHRKFVHANSPTLAEQAAQDSSRTKEQSQRQLLSQGADGQTLRGQEALLGGGGQNGASHLRHVHPEGAPKIHQPARPSTADVGGAGRTGGMTSASNSHGSPEERSAAANVGGWREAAIGMPQQSFGFHPGCGNGQQRMLAAMHMQNGRMGDFYHTLQFPMLLPNGSLPGPLRSVRPNNFLSGFAHLQSVGAQRHSDPGSSTDSLDATDAMLSGDLERLSQHLQSARAMFDSNQSMWGNELHARFSDGGGYKQHPGGSYGQGGPYPRGPQRSSSAGNLNHLRTASYPNAARRPMRPEANGNSSLPQDMHFHYPGIFQPVNGNGMGPRPRYAARNTADFPAVQRTAGAVDSSAQAMAAESRSVPSSEKAMSQPPSPATAKPNGHPAPLLGPMPVNPGPIAEWPLLGLKNRPLNGDWASGVDATRAGWSTASEGRPGWASPVGSTLSEQSLASLRGLRLGGASPAPVSPSVRGASLKSVQSGGSYEGQHAHVDVAQQSGVSQPPDTARQWRNDFVLAEEDFPVLPSSGPQPGRGPTKPASKPMSWLGEGRKMQEPV